MGQPIKRDFPPCVLNVSVEYINVSGSPDEPTDGLNARIRPRAHPEGLEFCHIIALNCHRNTFELNVKGRPPGPLYVISHARKTRMLRTALILDLPRITIINSSSNLIVVIRSTHQLGNYVSRWGASSIINTTFAKPY